MTKAPGIFLCLAFALVSLFIADLSAIKNSVPLSPLLLVLLLGMLWRFFLPVPEKFSSGIRFCQKPLLRIAVIGLGLKLSFVELFQIGSSSLIIILLATVTSLFFGFWISKRMGLSRELGVLLSVGTSICGASAILAAESVLPNAKKETSIALATITVLGTVAIFAFPPIGHFLNLSDSDFGVWMGASLQEMAHVVAAAFSFGEGSVTTAITVKLGRICLLAPVLFFIAYREKKVTKQNIPIIPWFIFGFVICAGIRTLAVIPEVWLNKLIWFDLLLLCMSMAAVGIQTDVRDFKQEGTKPLLAGTFQWVWISAVSLGLIYSLT